LKLTAIGPFCHNEVPGMADVYSMEFEVLYEQYKKEGRQHIILGCDPLFTPWHFTLLITVLVLSENIPI
jgi:hypothetical protein